MGFKSLLDRILLNFIIAGKNKVLVEIGTDCILPYNTAITKYPTTIASKKNFGEIIVYNEKHFAIFPKLFSSQQLPGKECFGRRLCGRHPKENPYFRVAHV